MLKFLIYTKEKKHSRIYSKMFYECESHKKYAYISFGGDPLFFDWYLLQSTFVYYLVSIIWVVWLYD